MRKLFIVLAVSGLIVSCNSESEKKEEKSAKKETPKETAPNYRELGKSITGTAQKTLLHHVGKAMKMNGPIAAIQYCNVNALTITDSLSQANNVVISRVTDKNRNPKNILSSDDASIWEHYKSGEINVQMKDTVISLDGKNIYYRPIYIANPTCLNCHGQEGTDIMDITVAKLNEFYPEDKARNYNLGELRGMWRVEFK